MIARQHTQHGYTLVEAMIAVALLAGLASTLAPAVFSAVRASSRVLSQGEEQEALRIADESLDQIITNMVVLASEPKTLQFRGQANQLDLISLAGPHAVAKRFTIKIENGTLSGLIAPLTDQNRKTQSTVLLPRGAISFSYFGIHNSATHPSWTTNWNSAQPPRLIRLEIARSDNTPITLEYSPPGRGFLHCAFDPVSRRCRV